MQLEVRGHDLTGDDGHAPRLRRVTQPLRANRCRAGWSHGERVHAVVVRHGAACRAGDRDLHARDAATVGRIDHGAAYGAGRLRTGDARRRRERDEQRRQHGERLTRERLHAPSS